MLTNDACGIHKETNKLAIACALTIQGSFLPEMAFAADLKAVIKDLDTRDSSEMIAFGWCIQLMIPALKATRFDNSAIIEDLWSIWYSLTSDSERHRVAPVALVENCFFEIFSKRSTNMCLTLTQIILSVEPTVFLHRCLLGYKNRRNQQHYPGLMLHSVLSFEFARFAPIVIQLLTENESESVRDLFEDGSLDDILQLLLQNIGCFDSSEYIFHDLVAKIMKRLVYLIRSEISEPSELLLSTAALVILMDKSKLLVHHPTKCDEAISAMCTMIGRASDVWFSCHLKFMDLGICLLSSADGKAEDDSRILASWLLLRLCKLTQQGLRESKTQDSFFGPRDLPLILLHRLVQLNQEYCSSFFEEDRQCLTGGFLRACIKHGMCSSPVPVTPSSLICLSVLRLFTEPTAQESPLCFLGTSNDPPTEAFVFDMITSHSNFANILGEETHHDSRKLEVLRLLHACLSAGIHIKFQLSLWKSLGSEFNASLGECDILIWNILRLYEKATGSVSKMLSWESFVDEVLTHGHFPFQHDITLGMLRWKGVELMESVKRPLDWLPNALELSRIRITLKLYPSSKIETNPKYLTAADARSSLEKVSSLTQCVESELPEAYVREDHDRIIELQDAYMPSFLLPLVFGCLEEALDELAEGSSEISSAYAAQRLCENGGLALVLASLCSECRYLRGIAFSALFSFKTIIVSSSARQLSTWRDRPQIAMLLNCVHKALALKSEGRNGGTNETVQLPGSVSIFLAKASLILMRPGDDLFPAVNRYFLKVETNGGAFQDLARLPMFMSTFCSAAEDYLQAEKERLWSMELLLDGFTDSRSFRTLIACHAPELLLTSANLFCDCQNVERDKEVMLLFQVLLRILDRGGERAESHLICKLGIFSWLQSLLLSKKTLDVLSIQPRTIFLTLVETVAAKARGILGSIDFAFLRNGFVQPILSFCLDSQSLVTNGVATTLEFEDMLVSSLSLLHKLTLDEVSKYPGIQALYLHAHGPSLALSRMYLDLFKHSEKRPSCILVLCQLPVSSVHLDESDVLSFCHEMLSVLGKCSFNGKQIVLKRVALFSAVANEVICKDASFIQHLLSVRQACANNIVAEKLWSECLASVMSSCKISDPTITLARQILSSLSHS